MDKKIISSDDFVMAYNDASEQTIRNWHWDDEEFDDWAGDVLGEFIVDFMRALGIEVEDEH